MNWSDTPIEWGVWKTNDVQIIHLLLVTNSASRLVFVSSPALTPSSMTTPSLRFLRQILSRPFLLHLHCCRQMTRDSSSGLRQPYRYDP